MIGGIEQFLTCWHTLSLLTLLIPLSLHSPFTISPSLARPILKIKKNNPEFEKVKILSHRKCHLWIVMNIVFIFFWTNKNLHFYSQFWVQVWWCCILALLITETQKVFIINIIQKEKKPSNCTILRHSL